MQQKHEFKKLNYFEEIVNEVACLLSRSQSRLKETANDIIHYIEQDRNDLICRKLGIIV